MKSPVFLFSMPRSGSTLLQRLLAGHSEIATISEPWILLPLLYANKTKGVISEYSHLNSQKAINDLIRHLPEKEESYYQCLEKFTTPLYSKLCKNNESYFLDKTPRYYLIIPEIIKLYPNAKFIFLFRSPVDIFSSILTTWGNNKFRRLYASEIDLKQGLTQLVQGYKLLQQRAYKLRYEDLVQEPGQCLKQLCLYLEIPFNNHLLDNLNQKHLTGRLGDPGGSKHYSSVESKSIDKWKTVFNTRFRRKLLKNYISQIDSSILEVQGYNKYDIIKEIKNLDVSWQGSLRDVADILFYKVARFLNAHLFFTKTYQWARHKYLS